MRRLAAVISLIALVTTACAGGDESGDSTPTSTEPATTATGESPDSTGPGSSPTTSPPAATTTSDRPLAPDFRLELGEGGTYTLSEGSKPVYLVFWAEW